MFICAIFAFLFRESLAHAASWILSYYTRYLDRKIQFAHILKRKQTHQSHNPIENCSNVDRGLEKIKNKHDCTTKPRKVERILLCVIQLSQTCGTRKKHTQRGCEIFALSESNIYTSLGMESQEKPLSSRIRPIFRFSDRGKWEKHPYVYGDVQQFRNFIRKTLENLHWNPKRTKNAHIHKINKGDLASGKFLP